MSAKKLSIITIGYNEARTTQTCQSIVNQTWQEFEWIVIDGGSKAETLAQWQPYHQRMNYFVSEPDQGIYNAMNKGLQVAHGDYVLFLNAGDCLHDTTTLEQVFTHTEYTADILYGDIINVSTKHHQEYRKPIHFPAQVDIIYFLNGYIAHNAAFIKRQLFAQYGNYDEHFKIAADLEKWFCFTSNNCRFQYLDYVISDFYLDGISSGNASLQAQERGNIFAKYCPGYETLYIHKIKLFGIIPLLKIEQYRRSKTIKLFNCLPIITSKCKERILLP